MRVDRDNLPVWFSYNHLCAMIYSRDYDSPLKAVTKVLAIDEQAARRRLNGNVVLNHDETITLARGFKMTPREYCDCFLNGLFEELKDD